MGLRLWSSFLVKKNKNLGPPIKTKEFQVTLIKTKVNKDGQIQPPSPIITKVKKNKENEFLHLDKLNLYFYLSIFVLIIKRLKHTKLFLTQKTLDELGKQTNKLKTISLKL